MAARNIYISFLSFVCIVGPGAFIFRNSEAATFAVEFVGFVVCFTLLHVLDDRDSRRRQSDD
jgi:hypothetical protein